MDIFQIIAIAVVGAVLAVTIKPYRPELAMLLGLATGLLVLFYSVDSLSVVMERFSVVMEKGGIDMRYFELVTKIIGVAYMTQFACELLKDCGEHAIALKVELAGKICIMLLAIPIISGFLDILIRTLEDF